MKKEIKIDYYDTFQCSADQCLITCCQEWNIEVDEQTRRKWEKVKAEEQKTEVLSESVEEVDGVGVIRLNQHRDCPFLNDQKLCSLVVKHGDEMISNTCATFPREIHEFAGRTEYSLVTCCPDVVDLLNQVENFKLIQDMSVMEEGVLFQLRTWMMELMQRKEVTPSTSLMMIFYLLLDLKQKGIQSIDELREYQKHNELSELSEAIDGMEFSKLATMEEQNEIFLDLAESYRKKAMYQEYLEPIAALAEELSESYEEEEMLNQLEAFEQQFFSYQQLLRNYLVSEIFNLTLLPESDLESMILMTQWIALEYATIKHAIFLRWMTAQSRILTYEMVRECIVIQSRMSGYGAGDIKEYLSENFQALIWEWGYLALIV